MRASSASRRSPVTQDPSSTTVACRARRRRLPPACLVVTIAIVRPSLCPARIRADASELRAFAVGVRFLDRRLLNYFVVVVVTL